MALLDGSVDPIHRSDGRSENEFGIDERELTGVERSPCGHAGTNLPKKGCDVMNLKLMLASAMVFLTVVFSGCAFYGSYGYRYSDYDDYYYRGYPYRGYHSHPYYGHPFHYNRDRDGK